MRPWYRFWQTFFRLLFIGLFRGRVFGLHNVPRTGGVLLICNHQSFLDPVLATLALPRECSYMARDSLFRSAFFKWAISSLNAFPVKRGTADVGAIKETLRRIKKGGLVTVFPEATRTEDGRVRPMQPGVVLIARKSGVPLVPTLILGAFECWPRHKKLPTPAPVIIAHGEPLWPSQLASLSDQEAIDQVRERILELMERYRTHSVVRRRVGRGRATQRRSDEATK